MVTQIKTRWRRDPLWFLYLFIGVAMFLWGFLNKVSPPAYSHHTFGTVVGWLDERQIRDLFIITGLLQILSLYIDKRWMIAATNAPAAFFNGNIVVSVLLSHETPFGSISWFLCAGIVCFISVYLNVPSLRTQIFSAIRLQRP